MPSLKESKALKGRLDDGTIKAVIFDNDGILSHRPRSIYDQTVVLLRKYGWVGNVKNFNFQWRKARRKSYVGESTLQESAVRFFKIAKLKYNEEAVRKLVALRLKSKKMRKLFPGVKATIRYLRSKGFVVAVLTDSSYPSNEINSWFKRNGVHFDKVFSSSDVGISKHNVKLFRVALRTLGFKPHQAVFMGHKRYEVRTAQRAGLFAISRDPIVKGDLNVGAVSDLKKVF